MERVLGGEMNGATVFGAGPITKDVYGGPPAPMRPRAFGGGAVGGFGNVHRIGKRPMSRAQIAAMKEKDRGR